MTRFDPELWRQRAWARFTRATRAISPKDKASQGEAERAWARDVIAIGDLEKVVGWCSVRCIDVNFVKKALGTYHMGVKQISISSRLGPVNQVAILLHECGHHLIGDIEHHDRFGMGYPMGGDPTVSRTFNHRVAVLDEEMEAWHRGWKLAGRLELALDRETFDKIRLDCVKSYIKWSINPGKKKEA